MKKKILILDDQIKIIDSIKTILELEDIVNVDSALEGKDAIDIYYVIKHYSKIPAVVDALYEQDYMDAQDNDIMNATAMLLADEVAAIVREKTLTYIKKQETVQPSTKLFLTCLF